MAKKNRRGSTLPLQNPTNSSVNNSGTAGSTASLLQRLNASMQVGTSILGADLDQELSLDIGGLNRLLDSFPREREPQLRSWLEKFTVFSRDLDRKNENLKDDFEKRTRELQATMTSLTEERLVLAQELASLETVRQKLDEEKLALNPRLESLATKEAEIVEKEEELRQREQDALNDFSRLKREQMAGLKTGIQSLEDTRDHLHLEVEQLKDLLNARQREKDLELVRRNGELDQREHQIKAQEIYISGLEVGLKNEREGIRRTIEDGIELEFQNFERESERLRQSHKRVCDKMDDLLAQQSEYDEIVDMLGGRQPQELMDELEKLRRDCRELKARFSGTDAEQLDIENQALREQTLVLQSEVRGLREQIAENATELHARRMAATDMAHLSAEKKVLEKGNQLLGNRINYLASQIDQITEDSKAKSAFPALSSMDKNPKLDLSQPLESVPDDLAAFADELRHRIAQAEGDTKLYYPIHIIRTLLGGLAMSQLHVFQGISGTGKTSLAKAFAKAMGGECTDIAVQAGWRDRDDLLGHYNAFEKRFYEKPCLQALYRAQTPAHSDSCNVILLDEMNLSRPEQYFSEFLSVLEKNDRAERKISLHESAMVDAPKRFVSGCEIHLPENVWFIGTANHDETTNELADKTYDRAHVMTMPRQDDTFAIRPYSNARYSFSSLQRRFDKAIEQYGSEARGLMLQLQDSQLPSILEEYFGLGWGNRLDRQGLRFIPVMIAAGASGASALDHLLATRILRKGKVAGRHDVGAKELGFVQDALIDLSLKVDEDEFVQSIALIEKDRQRLERGL